MPSSPEQNRKNALKSTGPKSDRGKAVSRQNNLQHGLRATKPPLLPGEDRKWFDDTVASLTAKYCPNDPIEHLLVERIAVGWLRLRRVWNIEAAQGDAAILKVKQRLSAKASELERRRLAKQLGEAELVAAGLSLNGEQLGRYECLICLELNNSIAKIEEIKQEQRDLAASMGSSGLTQFICDRLKYYAENA